MDNPLAKMNCRPCRGETDVLSEERARELSCLVPAWEREGVGKISRDFRFSSFDAARDWINRVAEIAGEQDHHPDIHWSYNRVRVELYTHKIGGLSENDFILAARIDRIP